MHERYETVAYELLRPAEVKALCEGCPIAYIPAGSLEWHGFQNPLGTDSLKAHAICCEAALAHGGVVLPPFYQGLLGESNWGPEGWGGYTLSFNQADVFEAAILGVARALVFSKWKVLVGVTGHDVEPQRAAMERAILAATKESDATGFAVREGDLHTPDDEIPFSMDHAAAWETSCMMYICPGKVDLDTLRARELSSDEDFEMSGPEGMGGKNPLRYASVELGEKIIERMGDLIGAKAKGML
ncbi:MAG: creatininase family protein [Planctomycetota bacterium]|jgi:creatinine amidohydrolase